MKTDKKKRDGSVRLDVDLGGACWIRTALVFVVVEVDLNREENKKALTNAHKLVCLFIILFFFFLLFFSNVTLYLFCSISSNRNRWRVMSEAEITCTVALS